MPVHFSGTVPSVLKNRKDLKKYIELIISDSGKITGNINFSFCDDEEILKANNQFLSHNFYTDILTFNLSKSSTATLNADILISTETVRSNSLKYHTSFIMELHRVIFHGILHLCGYNDKTKIEANKMRSAENYHLATYVFV